MTDRCVVRMDTVMKHGTRTHRCAGGGAGEEGRQGRGRCDEQIQCEDDVDDEGASKDEKDSEERRREAMMMIRRARIDC